MLRGTRFSKVSKRALGTWSGDGSESNFADDTRCKARIGWTFLFDVLD